MILIAGINFKVTKAADYGSSGTTVGGIIWENTTWTLENSPYIITDTVQIPENVMLTIEPSVNVVSSLGSYEDMFLLHGKIYAHGDIDNKIVFDGGGTSNFFSADGSNDNIFLDLDYCIVRNGRSFWWDGSGHFNLTHSELINLSDYSYVWKPGRNIYIEYNRFTNVNGINFTKSSKHGMAMALKQLMMSPRKADKGLPPNEARRKFELPFDKDVQAELNIEQWEQTPGSEVYTFSHPEGTHDDRFWAIALSVLATIKPEGEAEPDSFIFL